MNDTNPKSRTYARLGASDIIVHGELIGSISAQQSQMKIGDVWTDLDVWQLSDGDWLAARSQTTLDVHGLTFSEVHRIRRPNVGDSFTSEVASESEAQGILVLRAMTFFGWSWLAKDLADQLGWQITESIA